MAWRRKSVLLLASLYLILIVSLVLSHSVLPDRVATHFNASGEPNGWMTRSQHLLFMAAFGGLLPLFIIGICSATRYLPVSLVNIPNREYWLAEPRRAAAVSFLGWHSIWLGCLIECLLITLHWMMVLSNRRLPIALPATWAWGLLVPFLGALVVWIVILYRRFGSPPIEAPTDLAGPLQSR